MKRVALCAHRVVYEGVAVDVAEVGIERRLRLVDAGLRQVISETSNWKRCQEDEERNDIVRWCRTEEKPPLKRGVLRSS